VTVKNHTDLTFGAPAAAATFNSPLGQLDNALADLEAQLGDFVGTGGLAGTSATLIVAQPATRAFAINAWVNVLAQNLTMAASNDNYVDLDNAGLYHVTSVANGAGAPVVFANAIRLYKAVSNATAVTSVVDLRPVSLLRSRQQTAQIVAGVLTPDPNLGELVFVTLAAALTIAAPVNPLLGHRLKFRFVHDGTASVYAITWNAIYKKAGGAFANTNTANALDTIDYETDGVNFYEYGRALNLS
jgi:hypothetical protein